MLTNKPNQAALPGRPKNFNMDTNISTLKFATPLGVVLGLILIVIVVVMYVTGMLQEGVQWPMYLFYLIFPLYTGYVVHAYRKANGGYLSLGSALKVGVTAAIISGLVYLVYNLIFVYLIDPEFPAKMLEVARENMYEQNPNITEDQVEMAMGFAEKFSNPFLGGAFWIVMSAFFGFIYSLISGLIFKRERPVH
ncbi:MAG: DUF4199 domain-containing protein [Flavobacterium sp.]|nr:MAG: DUF4199 domain-containing protein [Flavobacterium sp.]